MLFYTYTGKTFKITDFNASHINLEDIAYGLAHINRYSGQTSKAYSVARHSINIAHFFEGKLEKQALLHDAAEAYLGDITAPVKNLFPDYKKLEEHYTKIIFKKFNIEYPIDDRVLSMDVAIRQYEKYWLMKNQQTPCKDIMDMFEEPFVDWSPNAFAFYNFLKDRING